jgi:hypothetical protein
MFRGPGSFLIPGASTNPLFDIVQLQSKVSVNENAASARFDYKINDRYTLYARYFRDQGKSRQPEGVSGRFSEFAVIPQNAVLSLQGMFTQRLLNEFRFGYNGAYSRVAGLTPFSELSSAAINLSGSIAHRHCRAGGEFGYRGAGRLIAVPAAFNGRGFLTPFTRFHSWTT